MRRPSFVPEEDEQVLLETGPHWIRLAPRLVPPLVLLAVCIVGFVAWTSAPIWFAWVLLAGVALALAYAGGRVASWRATCLVVTNERVVHRYGVLRRTGREIPVVRVQDVTYHQRLAERLLGIGEIRVASAGSGSTEVVTGLPDPAEVQRIVNRAVEAATRAPRARPDPDIAGQLERLEGLRRQGIVTEAEFARKKAELLARM